MILKPTEIPLSFQRYSHATFRLVPRVDLSHSTRHPFLRLPPTYFTFSESSTNLFESHDTFLDRPIKYLFNVRIFFFRSFSRLFVLFLFLRPDSSRDAFLCRQQEDLSVLITELLLAAFQIKRVGEGGGGEKERILASSTFIGHGLLDGTLLPFVPFTLRLTL